MTQVLPSDREAAIVIGDCRDKVRELPADSIDAIVTDPPYELDLMGYRWDATGIAYSVALWRECLRVLKPGAHLLAFGSSRTYHRLASAIEDAGFEIRDTIAWIHSGGFPKGLDIGKAIDRQRNDRNAVLRVTAFVRRARVHAGKTNREIDAHFGRNGMASHWTSDRSQPAVPTPQQWDRLKTFLGFGDEMDAEVAILNARKRQPGDAWMDRPITGHHAHVNAGQDWQVRHGFASGAKPRERRDVAVRGESRRWQGWGTTVKTALEPIVVARKPLSGNVAANVLRFGTGGLNLDACRLEAGRLPTNVMLDAEAAKLVDAAARREEGPRRARRGPTTAPNAAEVARTTARASRFFYVARASQAERRAGLAGAVPRHPTVKPIALMRELVRLVTPPEGIVLDPFAGTGTTGVAAVREGMRFIGIETEPAYADMAQARINHWRGEADDKQLQRAA